MQTPPTGQADPAEFATFMRAYQNMVFSTALRLTASRPQAEDIAQEVFLRAYEHFASLRDVPTAGGWLRTVATHLSLNHLSRHRRRWTLFSELGQTDDTEPAPFQPQDLQDELHEALSAADRHRRLEHAIAQLPDHQRVPLVLFHFEDLSYEAIATRLDISLAKVKTDIHRARLRLARLLVDTSAPPQQPGARR